MREFVIKLLTMLIKAVAGRRVLVMAYMAKGDTEDPVVIREFKHRVLMSIQMELMQQALSEPPAMAVDVGGAKA